MIARTETDLNSCNFNVNRPVCKKTKKWNFKALRTHSLPAIRNQQGKCTTQEEK